MSIKLGTNTINAIKLGTNTISKMCVGSTEIYNSNPVDYTEPFYVQNDNDYDIDVNLNIIGDSGHAEVYYSYLPLHAEPGQYIDDNDFDGRVAIDPTGAGGGGGTVTIPAESKVYFYIYSQNIYGDGEQHLSDGTNYFNIDAVDDIVSIGGNIMSLLHGEYFTGNERTFESGTTHQFFQLFADSTYIEDASNLLLPATTLNANCYQNMFMHSALTAAPILPATTLAGLCYANMFYGCRELTTAPSLPATTLAIRCYYRMFENCTSLTAAPILPAQTLATNCYESMFQGCSRLSSVFVCATSWNAKNAEWWLYQVSATGTFTKPSGTTIPESASGIPSGWTIMPLS